MRFTVIVKADGERSELHTDSPKFAAAFEQEALEQHFGNGTGHSLETLADRYDAKQSAYAEGASNVGGHGTVKTTDAGTLTEVRLQYNKD
jgi:hypothetical protein